MNLKCLQTLDSDFVRQDPNDNPRPLGTMLDNNYDRIDDTALLARQHSKDCVLFFYQ
jgi:hypothetical protein